ncbi:TetR family transcriptional regulator [Dictyobacter sp. S3.2.2.5]|uniref:TetR family transcriptional regulator n=1 Tax=Dictyobacter halimunensis TaxID=3026934 RepID=A0ABQ6G5H6_9CHLR|nr:TetR family transcriptional regulator [Dictyobacter sp. S3.2.2.5]
MTEKERGGLRERNKQQKFQRIKQAAQKCFETRGYEATQMREIAEEAQVGVGTVFLYVQNKQELLVLVYLDALSETLKEAFASVAEGWSLQEKLVHIFRLLLRFYARHPENSQVYLQTILFLQNKPGQHQDVARLNEYFLRELLNLFEQARRNKEIRADLDLRLAVQLVFALYYAALTSWTGSFSRLDEALQALPAAFELLFQGFHPLP